MTRCMMKNCGLQALRRENKLERGGKGVLMDGLKTAERLVVSAIAGLLLSSWSSWISGACASGVDVNLTTLSSAVSTGAVCLDGSAPGYNLDRGSGSGINRWLVHLDGGGWCQNMASCVARSNTSLGSSLYMHQTSTFGAILSNSPAVNPYFYNWNRVLLRYCDGGSFSGNVDSPIPFQIPGETKPRNLYFRGEAIWQALIEHLLLIGMNTAQEALLSGNSAGGLASMIHCNSFKEMLPASTNIKCLSDGGFFIDVKDISGQYSFRQFFSDVIELQNITSTLPNECIKNHIPVQCFFPHNLIQYIKVPLFILNAAYDSWQWNNVLVPSIADPNGTWTICKHSPKNCSSEQLKILQDFRSKMLAFLSPFASLNEEGLFIISCFYHNIALSPIWNTTGSEINNKTAAEAVGEWFFEGKKVKTIDCAYPCNPNCMGVLT